MIPEIKRLQEDRITEMYTTVPDDQIDYFIEDFVDDFNTTTESLNDLIKTFIMVHKSLAQ